MCIRDSTYIPLANRATFEHWLAASQSEHGCWHEGAVEEGSLCAAFMLPSYLITNYEITALRRLLARGSDAGLALSLIHI